MNPVLILAMEMALVVQQAIQDETPLLNLRISELYVTSMSKHLPGSYNLILKMSNF